MGMTSFFPFLFVKIRMNRYEFVSDYLRKREKKRENTSVERNTVRVYLM